MCLDIDGQTFCDVLTNAPPYEGMSLERVEHNIEENKRPYTDEAAAVLARTCGLALDVYRDRIVRIRSQNVLRQMRYRNPLSYSFGPYFVLPQECEAYMMGTSHGIPMVPFITPESQEALTARLKQFRFEHLCLRIDRGITKADLASYPEWDLWAPLVFEKLQLRQRMTVHCRQLLERNTVPPSDMYYPERQLDKLLRIYVRWFYDRTWQKPPAVIRLFMSPDEVEALDMHLRAYRQIHERKPKGKRAQNRGRGSRESWRNELGTERNAFLLFKFDLKQRILQQVQEACREGVATVPVAQAA